MPTIALFALSAIAVSSVVFWGLDSYVKRTEGHLPTFVKREITEDAVFIDSRRGRLGAGVSSDAIRNS